MKTRLKSFLLLGVITLSSACGAHAESAPVAPASVTGSRYLLPPTAINGIDIAEVSGLAWDADEQTLYGVSDQGYIYHFALRRDGAQLRTITPVFAARLVDLASGEGTPASGKHFNAEGLALQNADNGIRGDTALLVALEEYPPQLARFSADGRLLGRVPVPAPANDMANFKKKNRGLESVLADPVRGALTAPESPLRGGAADLHTLYATGQSWSFAQYAGNSRLKELARLPDGTVLVLERSRPGPSKDVYVASLRRLDIAACKTHHACPTTQLATLPAGPDNFEGLAVLDNRHLLIVSDNGDAPARGTTFELIGFAP